MTFLILQNFSSHQTPCLSTYTVNFLLTLHKLLLILQIRTAQFISSYYRCDIPDTADFLHKLHTLSSFSCSTLSICSAQPSLRTADVTLLVLHRFSLHTVDVTFLMLQNFSSNHTPCPPTAGVAPLTLYTLSSHCTSFLCSYCQCDPALFLSPY